MATSGVIFKRCGCKEATTGRRLDRACPRLVERDHGTWYFHCSAANLLRRSERVRRGGYPSQAAARRARDEWHVRGLWSGGCGTGCRAVPASAPA
jgi:hypothetical protein